MFIAPNAPFRFDGAPSGFQWFSISDPSKEQKLEGVKMAAPILNALINHLLAEFELDESKMAIVGFSQGTMMGLHVGLRRVKPLAGIIGYSGALVGAELLADEIKSKPPVLLMHGNMDPIVPPDMMHHAEDTLKNAGVPVAAYLCPNLGHGLDDMCIQLGMEFLAEMFGVGHLLLQLPGAQTRRPQAVTARLGGGQDLPADAPLRQSAPFLARSRTRRQ